MPEVLQNLFKETWSYYETLCHDQPSLLKRNVHEQSHAQIQERVSAYLENQKSELRETIVNEIFGMGPLQELIDDVEVTEILVNHHSSIWYEKNGQLKRLETAFLSEITYRNTIEKLLSWLNRTIDIKNPYISSHYDRLRITVVSSPLTSHAPAVSIRKHPKTSWSLEDLINQNSLSFQDAEFLEGLILARKNLLIIGTTGSGKTSLLSALLQKVPKQERILVLEDTREILVKPEANALQLSSRIDIRGELLDVTLTDLLKLSLRLRPDRIVVGEMRGDEAKDFLLTLSTGHRGCLATLHAESPLQALLRLEMLVQLAAPQWTRQTVQRLISLSLDMILVVERTACGKRKLKSCSKIQSLEETGFTLEEML